jgi:hypothetical protein
MQFKEPRVLTFFSLFVVSGLGLGWIIMPFPVPTKIWCASVCPEEEITRIEHGYREG